ncbi:MAG TPA: DEAD/DEAH box helicase [Panacibacter sp.]|nr:DEAD/DEAH box helicase [Panacibacter sp.]
MIIDIHDNKIIVNDLNNSLNSVGRSQLSFWDFKYDYTNKNYSIALEKQLFLKVINYFENENIVFELKKEAKKYSEEIEIISLNFNNLKELAAKYKNGKFDKIQFDKFREHVAQNIKRSLKIHQLKSAYHLYLLGNAANFSVPGSGKTSVVLTVYEKLRQEGKVNTLFVVGPPSCFGPWRNEFYETLGRKPEYTILAGGNKINRKNQYFETSNNLSELYLTSFHSLLFDQKEVNHFLKQKHVRAFLVVDEAHYIKQINGNWAHAILTLSQKTEFRCVLTGTPMPKSYTDIFNLFDFLWPNNEPITSHEKNIIKHNEEKGNRHSIKNLLDNSIGPLFYRVRKSDLNLKAQNFFSPQLIKMGEYERIIYDATFKRIKNYSKDDYYKNIDFVNKLGRGRIMRLRQCVSYPKLLNSAIEEYDENLFTDLTDLKNIIRQYDKLEVPGKIKYLLRIVKQFQKKSLKIVIWSNFIGTISLIERHLKAEGFYCKKIIGSTPVESNLIKAEETREKIRDEFVDGQSGLDILIANPAACAESISLHKTCHSAIYYDLTYNCAQYLQSLDRIHRVGGSEDIEANYYFLQYENSIDADIKKNIEEKSNKMFEIIEEEYPIYSLNMFEADGDAEAYNRIFKVKKK